jgi:hypothetical protein
VRGRAGSGLRPFVVTKRDLGVSSCQISGTASGLPFRTHTCTCGECWLRCAVLCCLVLARFGFGGTFAVLPSPTPTTHALPRRLSKEASVSISSAHQPVCPCFGRCRLSYARSLTRSSSRAVVHPLCYAVYYASSLLLLLDLSVSLSSYILYIRPRLLSQLLPARHAPCCPTPHRHHHGPLDTQPPALIARPCPPTARMSHQQCHVKSISSGQCNTATPASALLLWHICTADCPSTKSPFAPK